MGQLQEIVLGTVYLPVPDGLRPLCQFHDNPFLVRGADGLDDLGTSGFQLWCGQFQHVRRPDIRNHGKHAHQLRQVVELGEPVLHLVAVALRPDFQRGRNPSESSRPGIEHQKPPPLQLLRLQGLLHHI